MPTRSMTGVSRRTVMVVVAVVVLGLSPLTGAAESTQGTPEVIVCGTAAIAPDRYAEAAADTSDDVGMPDPVPYWTPTGTTAGADVIDAVEATLGQVVACVNEGRIDAFLNLFTTTWLSGHVGDFGELPEAPESVPEGERLSLLEVSDVVVLGDGRVAALVRFDQNERVAPELTSVMLFVPVDGGLLIDFWQPVTLPADVGGTPAPGPCDGATPALDAVCDPTPVAETPVAGGWELVSGEGYAGVIAPADQAVSFDYYLEVEPTGSWTPDAAQIAALEAGLPAYLGTFWSEPAAGLDDALSGYTRQYAGLVIDGRALIYVNAFCANPRDDDLWTSTALFNAGGGACYVQLFHEPATGAYYDLRVNEDTGTAPAAGAWETVSGGGYTGVIAPLDRAPIFREGYGTAASGWWLPTAEEVAALEAGLPEYLASVDDARAKALAGKVGTYLRQYAGLVVEGRALVFVNALCDDPTGGRWTSEPVFVEDGGDCFFQVIWEPATGEFRELAINGEA